MSDAYREAGVDLEAQDQALDRVKELVRSTYTPGVMSDLGAFGGLFKPPIEGLREPVLVASADGVGTKLMVARMVGDFSTVGTDLVNHCINDILVQGARPLFFLDYLAAGVLEPGAVEQLVSGVAAACRANGCALLGGETAEMPGFYGPGDYELVGFVVGLVDRPGILDGSTIRAGDTLIGLPSSGLHTNGYSLVRRILFEQMGLAPGDSVEGLEGPLGKHLLEPHRSYLGAVAPLLGHPALKAIAHITGGGLTDNLPRVLPDGTAAVIDSRSWRIPEIFQFLERHGGVTRPEMLRVFNMGVGLVLVLASDGAPEILQALRDGGESPWVLGQIETGDGRVTYRDGC